MSKRQPARGSILVKPKEAMESIAWSLWAYDLNPGAPRAVATEEGVKITAPDERSSNIIQILAKGIASGDLPCRVLFQNEWVELDPPSEENAAKLLAKGELRIYRDPLIAFADKLVSADKGEFYSPETNRPPETSPSIRTAADPVGSAAGETAVSRASAADGGAVASPTASATPSLLATGDRHSRGKGKVFAWLDDNYDNYFPDPNKMEHGDIKKMIGDCGEKTGMKDSTIRNYLSDWRHYRKVERTVDRL